MSDGLVLFCLFVLIASANVAWQWRAYAAGRRMAEGKATEAEMRRWITWARRTWNRRERL